MTSEPAVLDWDQQFEEPDAAYAYFIAYRNLGRARTVAQVADGVHRSRDYLHKLATEWRWVARARAFDAEQDRVYAESLAERRREMADRHARIAAALQGKLVARLQSLDASKLSAADVARWLEVATRVERLALGLPESTTAHTGPDGGPIEVEVAGMSEERRTAFLRALIAEAQARAGTALAAEATPLDLEAADSALEAAAPAGDAGEAEPADAGPAAVEP